MLIQSASISHRDFREESMQYMQCMVHYDSNYVTLAGHQDRFYEVDMTSGELYQREVRDAAYSFCFG